MSRKTTEERFWAKVDKSDDGCWTWTGSSHPKQGYGNFWYGGRLTVAHRASYAMFKGPVPDDMFVCHSCDNPPCVNPDHLWLGTAAENQADAKRKGRALRAKGESNGKSKLTEPDVLEILKSEEPPATLGQRYGVSPSTVHDILQKRCWSHVAVESPE